MNFYRRRPLALILTFCAVFCALGAYIPGGVKLGIIALCALAVPMAIMLFKEHGIGWICNLKASVFAAVSGALIMCTLLISYAYYDVYFEKYDLLENAHVRATVTEVRSSTPYGALYKVRTSSLDSERCNVNGLVYTETMLALSPGDMIEFSADFHSLGGYFDGYYDSPEQMLADGCAFICETLEDAALENTVLSEKNKTLEVRFSLLREHLSAKIGLYLKRDSASLSRALLLAERDGLGRIKRDFTYIGVSHLFAISGIHISILSGKFDRFLLRIGVGRRLRHIIVALLVLFYAALTGFSVSAVRAALMLIITYLAFMVNATPDRVTVLFCAGTIITFVSPAAIFDVGFQLSFLATLGLTVMSEAAQKENGLAQNGATKNSKLYKWLGKFSVDLAASLGATVFILPLQWIYFGEVSLLSVPATLLFSVLCEALLTLLVPYLICAAAGAHLLCGRLAWLIEFLSTVSANTAEYLASFSPLVSLNYRFTAPIIAAAVIVIAVMFFKNVRSWLYSLIPVGAACIVFFTCLWVRNAINESHVTLDMISRGKSDAICVISGNEAMLIDIGDGSGELMYRSYERLRDEGITYVDTVLLTGITSRHANSLNTLFNYRMVGQVLVPVPTTEVQKNTLDAIWRTAEEYGSRVMLYSREDAVELQFEHLSVHLSGAAYLKRSERVLNAISFSYGGNSVVYLGASAWENENLLAFADGAQYLLLGAAGPNVKTPPTGKIDDSVHVVYTPTRELADAVMPWLYGFSGTHIVGDELAVSLEPKK